eukprot:scaffold7992_cov101-Isochrysis_galbana.AAC.1
MPATSAAVRSAALLLLSLAYAEATLSVRRSEHLGRPALSNNATSPGDTGVIHSSTVVPVGHASDRAAEDTMGRDAATRRGGRGDGGKAGGSNSRSRSQDDDDDDEGGNGGGGCAEHCRRSKGKYANGAPFLLLLAAFLFIPLVLFLLDITDRRRWLWGRAKTGRRSRAPDAGWKNGYVGARPVSPAAPAGESSDDDVDEMVKYDGLNGLGQRAMGVSGASERA